MDDFLNRAAAHFAARQRIARRSKEAPQQLIGADTNGFGDPVPRCEQIGDHGDVVSAGLWKQHRAVALQPLRNGGKLIGEFHALAGDSKLAALGKVGEPGAQVLRRVRRSGSSQVIDLHDAIIPWSSAGVQGAIFRGERRLSASSSPQRRTTPMSTSNRSSTRPTVCSTMSSRLSGLA